LIVPLFDGAPTLALRADSRYGYVVGTPVLMYAIVGDPDDTPSSVGLSWNVFPPAGATYTMSDVTVPPDPTDPMHVQYGKALTSSFAGNWDVQVTATDPIGTATMRDLPFTIAGDHPPCLSSWAPIAAPQGQALPISTATLFQVLVVGDDLDPYPAVLGDATYGTTSFSWSLLPPGATTRQPLTGVSGNSVGIDPAAYAPGDVLELRVEIEDRTHTAVPCADSAPTCSVIADPNCTQRLTWRVEAQ
jgi:hypothetical protein